jgi:hypothetical protein
MPEEPPSELTRIAAGLMSASIKGINFLFGDAFTTQRFDRTVVRLFEMLQLGNCPTAPLHKARQFSTP